MGSVTTTATERLAVEAAACRLCQGVVGGSAALDLASGPARRDWLFVGEAPGRLGAGRTGVPLAGDRAGQRFARLLKEAGLRREDACVTNAVLCLPLDSEGRNRRPSRVEIRQCGYFLAATVEAVNPRVVVALGAVALEALGLVEPHSLVLGREVAQVAGWRGRRLVALYHPGWRAEVHRTWERQMDDWRTLRALMASRGRT